MSNCTVYMIRANDYDGVTLSAAAMKENPKSLTIVKDPLTGYNDFFMTTSRWDATRLYTADEYRLLSSSVGLYMFGRNIQKLFRAWNKAVRVHISDVQHWDERVSNIAKTHELPVLHTTENGICVGEDESHVFGVVRCKLSDFVNHDESDIANTLASLLLHTDMLHNITYEVVGTEPDNTLLVYVSGDKVIDEIHFDVAFEACNALKEVFVFCSVTGEMPSRFSLSLAADANETAIKLKKRLEENIARAGTVYELEEALVNTANAVPQHIREALDKAKEQADRDGEEWYRSFGEFWNEVPIPRCLYDAFVRYVGALAKVVPGMLGVERNKDDAHYDENTVAFSLYDLSDFFIVFKDEASASKFADGCSVDPIDLMYWTGDGWESE